MNASTIDPLMTAREKLYDIVAADLHGADQQWIDGVHDALGEAAAAIQEEVQAAPKSLEQIGDLNPDFESAPVTQRHVETMREQLIQLGEKVHELRADLRQTHAHLPLNLIQVRLRCQEIAAAIDDVRQADDRFFLETFNSNPGSGE